MLIIKKRNIQKGFSLIELMIAAAILVIALLGIFHAYSVGFMGMADARDRTVATNYAREAMEDIKNMDFELITNENLSTAEIIDGKFNKVVTVVDEHDNLKKITTLFYWNNRNGKTINVETTMYINETQFNPGEAAKIILYANPYYTVVPSAGTTNLIAVIKDINGNTKIDWSGGDIHFSILGNGYSDFPKNGVGSYLGYLGDSSGTNNISITPNNGVAETTFTASLIDEVAQEGNVIIEASVELPDVSTVSDTVTITVTLNVVRIELTANPMSIDADGVSTSTITAALKNSAGSTVTDATNNITFNISGEGTFVDSEGGALPNTTTITPSNGVSTIFVKSINDTPGVATVTASSAGLLSDTIDIITTGGPHSISVSVNPDSIYMDGTAEVIVIIRDIKGVAVDFTGTINLNVVTETSNGDGNFNPVSVIFDGTTSAETAIFTPTAIGNATIRASDAFEVLTEGDANITISDVLVADHITVSAIPQNIEVGGTETSNITAQVKTEDNIIVSTYVEPITFETTLGNFSNGIGSITLTIDNLDYENGIANVELFPPDTVGEATITVSSGGLTSGSVEVGFYSSAHHIELIASPQKMLVNGDTCTITATIVDESGTQIFNYNEDITFTILEGWPSNAKFTLTNTSSLTQTVINGAASVELTSQSKAGTVKFEASSFNGTEYIFGYLNMPVGITLELATPPNITYNSGTYQVSFDIDVQGAELNLEEMQVSWDIVDPQKTLTSVTIEGVEVYSNSASNGTTIDINDTILSTSTSTINLYFETDITEILPLEITVIFNPNSGDYSVPVEVPLL
ncbi:hypothetical protein ES703_03934 [subsurface metagenome]